jgi:hypothetical protein
MKASGIFRWNDAGGIGGRGFLRGLYKKSRIDKHLYDILQLVLTPQFGSFDKMYLSKILSQFPWDIFLRQRQCVVPTTCFLTKRCKLWQSSLIKKKIKVSHILGNSEGSDRCKVINDQRPSQI